MAEKDHVNTSEYRVAAAYYTTLKEKTANPRSLRCLENVWVVGNKMLDRGEKITSSALARRCLDQFGEPSVQTIYNNSSGLNPLVKKLQDAHSASSTVRKKTSKSPSMDQTMGLVLDGVNSPKHRSIIRDVFLENQQLKSDIRILDAFVKGLRAADLSHGQLQANQSAGDEATPVLTVKEKEAIRSFLTTTLFDEGYDLRDGEIYKGRRPLQANGFVSAILRVIED